MSRHSFTYKPEVIAVFIGKRSPYFCVLALAITYKMGENGALIGSRQSSGDTFRLTITCKAGENGALIGSRQLRGAAFRIANNRFQQSVHTVCDIMIQCVVRIGIRGLICQHGYG